MSDSDRTMQAIALWDRWRRAVEEHETRDTDKTLRAEQRAFDNLVEYVEANGLNYSRLDPRGEL